MSDLASSPSPVQSTEAIGQGEISSKSQRQGYASFFCFASSYWLICHIWPSSLTVSIHILDDDSLLNVFYLYRPFLLGEGEDETSRLIGGEGGWVRGRWWYNLAHVCQRWRKVILGSASYLGVSLVCANGTPVADMLAHSPPLPLVIDYKIDEDADISAEDEEHAILALKRYDCVRHVRFLMPVTSLQNLIAAMDDEYPILEHLIIMNLDAEESSILIIPETLQAPHLRHLTLIGFTLPIRSRLLTTAVDLVTLYLSMVHPSAYLHPNTLLQWLSSMPQLETLIFGFVFPVPNRDVEMQLTHTHITAPVAILNLRSFTFQGAGAYLEAIIHRLTAPSLEMLRISIFNQLTFSVPRLVHFVDTTENLRFKRAKFEFGDHEVRMKVYPHEEAKMYALYMIVDCYHLDWQVSSAAQISSSLSPTFSAVEHLTLGHSVHNHSSGEHNEADPIEWRKLLRSFRNVKTLRIAEGLVKDLSRCLELDDGGLPLELLPELQELTYSGSGNTGDAFTSFIDARQDTGRSISLIRHSPSPDPGSSVPSVEPPSITPAPGEGGSDLDT